MSLEESHRYMKWVAHRSEPELLCMCPKGQWCEETQFASVVHDSCKGNGFVAGGAAPHCYAGVYIFPSLCWSAEGYHLWPSWLQPGGRYGGTRARQQCPFRPTGGDAHRCPHSTGENITLAKTSFLQRGLE